MGTGCGRSRPESCCSSPSRHWLWVPVKGKIYVYIWWKRTNMSNIVWCLENYIHPSLHKEVFRGIRTPVDVKEKATEPPDWDTPSTSGRPGSRT